MKESVKATVKGLRLFRGAATYARFRGLVPYALRSRHSFSDLSEA
jgi:hypothetical protein